MKKLICLLAFMCFACVCYSQKTISIDSASAYVGQLVSINSKVYGVKSFEKVTLINLGAAYPKSPLTIAIMAKDLSNFETSPEKLYGKQIVVTGTVKEFKGKPEIMITNQSEIKIVADPTREVSDVRE